MFRKLTKDCITSYFRYMFYFDFFILQKIVRKIYFYTLPLFVVKKLRDVLKTFDQFFKKVTSYYTLIITYVC